ncbi:hypothetical protein JCM1841_003541 [Sporobolomyces salmonicolor]
MSTQRKGPGKGGKRGGKAASGAHRAAIYNSKRPVGGKGIFVTCIRGKESRCVGEMYDILDEVADRLYPSERIEKMKIAREAQLQKGEPLEGDDGMGEDEPSTEEARLAPAPAPVADDSDDEDDDIEASIQKELAALKAGRGGTGVTKTASKDDKGKGKAKERPRFQSIETGTECLCFIATAWPYDPVELVEAIVSEVQETGQSRTRFAQRLSPTTITCHSSSVDQVELQSARLIEQAFTSWATANQTTTISYQIEPSLRSHTAPLSRAMLLPLLGSQISRLSSAPTVSSPCPSRPLLSVRADLKNPDLVLLPTVLKNCYGLSIVEGKLWRGKKFNLEQIAMEVRRRKGAEEATKGKEAATQVGPEAATEPTQPVQD